MIKPTGKIPSVVPGNTNIVAPAMITGNLELASGTVILKGDSFSSMKRPATYDNVSDERVVEIRWLVLGSVVDSVMLGISRIRRASLYGRLG